MEKNPKTALMKQQQLKKKEKKIKKNSPGIQAELTDRWELDSETETLDWD